MNDRGRVPFALVGVLLVLTSTTLAVSATTGPTGESPAIDDAMDGATATTVSELREATDDAATAAAIDPVTNPDDTTAGRALNDSQPFVDALRLRIYLRALERVDGIETTRGPVTVTASLPSVEATRKGYRTAIERVSIERAGQDDAALGVRIDGLTLSASRDGRTVSTVERSPRFVVSNPALLLHERTERFEARANAPVTESGLGQRLTARLYPIAWTRGYAQYGGAPISTVLGTRHIEVATNDALLAEQRATFGEADPDGHRGVAAGGRRVMNTDAIVGVGGDEEWVDDVLGGADALGSDPPPEQPVGTWREEPEEPEVTVAVNASADHAFAETTGLSGDDRLDGIIERVHTVEAGVETGTRFVGRSSQGTRSAGGGWALVSTTTDTSVDSSRVGSGGPSMYGWTTVDSGRYEVTVTRTTTRSWEKNNDTTTTELTRKRIYEVGISVGARTVPVDGAPEGRIDGHLRNAAGRAAERALTRAGGFDGAAETAARGGSARSRASATAEPAIERSTVESDLGDLRDRTAAVSVTLPAPAVGTGRANPPERLRAEVDGQRDELLPDADPTASERTRRAARLVYLRSLDDVLANRTSSFEDAGDGIGDELGEYLGTDRLDGALAAHREPSDPGAEPIADPAGNLTLSVDTAPSYLTTRKVTRDRIDGRGGGSVYPLTTRSVNVFSSPHGQVAEGVFDRIPFLSAQRVSLSTAARTLAAIDPNAPEYDDLKADVDSSTAHVRGELVAELIDAGASEHDAEAALRTDLSTAEEALALTNGTTIERAAASVEGPPSSERLELRMETRLDDELSEPAARPSEPTTTDAQEAAADEFGDELEDTLADGLETAGERARAERLGDRLGALPAGLPLAPVPGYWYATANVWYTNVGGEYEHFAVRTNRSDGTAKTTYLRDGRTVSVTHDGEPRRLGTAEAVSFETRTAVVVVVPPGPRGVGDTDGEPIKTSPGW